MPRPAPLRPRHRQGGERPTSAAAASGAEARINLLTPSHPALAPDAPVTIVEISDFECPYCQKASQTLAELRTLYPGKLRLVFRNFPLDESCNKLLKRQIHENACAAARAAFCAGEQGQFWPYAEKALWRRDRARRSRRTCAACT